MRVSDREDGNDGMIQGDGESGQGEVVGVSPEEGRVEAVGGRRVRHHREVDVIERMPADHPHSAERSRPGLLLQLASPGRDRWGKQGQGPERETRTGR